MISPVNFHELVSGRKGGLIASLTRGALGVAEVAYAAAVRSRNHRYDCGVTNVYHCDATVVSIGNLTVGGAGKTPLVEWVTRRLGQWGVRPAILSRGYGTPLGEPNDEALELELALPGVIHLQNPDRCSAAHDAVERWGASALVLDDGFQHRRLARDLDIVLLDANQPFGYGRLLPRGLLREPSSSLARAQLVVLSRADMLDTSSRSQLRRRAAQLAPRADWCEVVHQPTRALSLDGDAEDVQSFQDQPVVAFCGIGNPAAWRHTLATLDCRVLQFRAFPDHHAYSAADCEALAGWARSAGATTLLCTRKDLVKLNASAWTGLKLRAIEVGIRFETGQAKMELALRCALGLDRDEAPFRRASA